MTEDTIKLKEFLTAEGAGYSLAIVAVCLCAGELLAMLRARGLALSAKVSESRFDRAGGVVGFAGHGVLNHGQ